MGKFWEVLHTGDIKTFVGIWQMKNQIKLTKK